MSPAVSQAICQTGNQVVVGIACVHVVTTTIHSSSSTNTSNLSQTSGNQVVDTDTDTYTYGACVVTEDTPPLERLEQRTALEVSIVGERYSELS